MRTRADLDGAFALLERQADAYAAAAEKTVGTADSTTGRLLPLGPRRRGRWRKPTVILAAAAVTAGIAVAAAQLGATSGPSAHHVPPAAPHSTRIAPSSSSAPTTPAAPVAPVRPEGPVTTVHVTSIEGDGQTYGVGMPVILRFSPAPTDPSAFTKAAIVTVDGRPAHGAWFWEQPLASQKHKDIIEAHYRMKGYWPANSTVRVKLPIGGLSAGKGLVYSGKLTSLTFRTGDAHITTVDGAAETMSVTSNGRLVQTFNVSLGKSATPTYNGTKIVMQKGERLPGTTKLRPKGAVRMIGPGYDEIVDWSVRLTNSGEYIHAAPWNSRIGQASTSNGCTNMTTKDAEWYYNWTRVGDVVIYRNTGGGTMPSWDGYGGWNLNWSVWKQGGLLRNK